MMVYTHVAFALMCSLMLTRYFFIDSAELFLTTAGIASVLVDIDRATSWISRKLEPVSITVKAFFRHRGLFHSLAAAFIICAIFYAMSAEAAIAAFVGYTSHITIDALNPSGVRPFSPFLNNKIKGPVKVGGFAEHIFLVLILSWVAYLLI